MIKNICKDENDNSPAKNLLMKILISSISERDYSAQEVCHIIMDWPLYVCTRKFVTVLLYEEQWKRIKVIH